MEDIAQIKKLLKEGKLVVGSDLTLKGLRDSRTDKVFVAANCPEDTKATINHYAELSGADVAELGIDNTELGDVCKKPFNIAVVSVEKQ